MSYSMLFSIIVPVYNIENYLDKCLDSILRQETTDYEIILVDDGSTDSSSSICDKRCQERADKISVIHKANSGQSDARNMGIMAANGDYLVFVDGDDYLESNALTLLEKATKENTDVILSSGYYKNHNNTEKKCCSFPVIESKRLDGVEALTLSSKIGANWNPWGKAFSRRFWLEVGLMFPSGRRWEDFAVIDQVIIQASSVSVVSPFYHYVVRKGSTINSIRESHVRDALAGVKDWIMFWQENQYPNELTCNLKNLQAKIYANTVMGYLPLVGDKDKNHGLWQECQSYSHVLEDYLGIEGNIIRGMVRIIGFRNTCRCLGLYKKVRYRK